MHLEQYEPQASWRSSIWMFVAGTAVGAAAAHHRLEGVEGRHHRTGAKGEGGLVQARPVVQAEHGLHREAIEEALRDHSATSALVLLGGLEDEVQRARAIGQGGQISGGPEQHGHVPVVAAGVHPARGQRAVLRRALLFDGEGVHVGA